MAIPNRSIGIIGSCNSWDELFESIACTTVSLPQTTPAEMRRATAQATKLKGDIFEYICKIFFLVFGEEFGIIDCRLNSELTDEDRKKIDPNLDRRDIGIDLYAYTTENTYIGIQAKFRSKINSTVVYRHLSTFILSCNKLERISDKILFTNTTVLNKDIRKFTNSGHLIKEENFFGYHQLQTFDYQEFKEFALQYAESDPMDLEIVVSEPSPAPDALDPAPGALGPALNKMGFGENYSPSEIPQNDCSTHAEDFTGRFLAMHIGSNFTTKSEMLEYLKRQDVPALTRLERCRYVGEESF